VTPSTKRVEAADDVPFDQLSASGVVIVAGKGGVGKTTVTAVVARMAADRGLRVLVVELDDKPGLAALLPDLHVRTIRAASALDEYLQDHGFGRIASRLNASGVIDIVGTAAPGIDDLVVLGKIKQLERSEDWDLIVVDGPAAGHAITMLLSASGVLDAVAGGPMRSQASDVLELLTDPQRCQVVLVTLAETTPVNETIETAGQLLDRVGIGLGPIVVNGVEPGIDEPPVEIEAVLAAAVEAGLLAATDVEVLGAASRFLEERRAMQRREMARLEQLDRPLIRLEAMPVAGLDAAAISTLAEDVVSGAGWERRR
jgi:anion-transporting  ArsA/GET3 family ATPase